MGERKGTKGLELWCRKMTEGYPGVKIENMTTSWRDGLAFCAIIHHFRPDLIDFDKLNKNDIYLNNEMAFRVAEDHLGIPALLDPEDMVEYEIPDRLSILTYLSQFYQTFQNQRGNSVVRTAPKRPSTSQDHGLVSSTSSSPPTKIQITIGRTRRDSCLKCGNPVSIVERLKIGKSVYHRTCFKCARCNSQLTQTNFYETENDEFCCEMCPDEERKIAEKHTETTVLTRPMCDEEKSARLQNFSSSSTTDPTDIYSNHFETALDLFEDSPQSSSTGTPLFMDARTRFFDSQLERSDNNHITLVSDKEDHSQIISNNNNEIELSSGNRFDTKESNISQKNIINNSVDDNNIKSFSNNKKSDDDVNKKISIPAKGAIIVDLDDLEDFDNISLRKDVDIKNEVTASINNYNNNESDEERIDEKSLQLLEDHITDHSDVIIVEDEISNIIIINSSEDDLKINSNVSNEDDSFTQLMVTTSTDEQECEQKIEDKMKKEDNIDSIILEDEISQKNILETESDLSYENRTTSPITIGKNIDQDLEDTIPETPKSKLEISSLDETSSFSNNEDNNNDSEEKNEFSINETKPIPSARPRKKIQLSSALKNTINTPTSQISYTRSSLNPFEDEDDDDGNNKRPPVAQGRKKIIPILKENYLNPFEDDDDEEEEGDEEEEEAQENESTLYTSINSSQTDYNKSYSSNPFDDDDDDDEDAEEESKIKQTPLPAPRVSPKRATLSVTTLKNNFGGSSSSLSSVSTFGSSRKKKPAPRPPIPFSATSQPNSLLANSLIDKSPITTLRRKNKRAPPPPPTISTPNIQKNLLKQDPHDHFNDLSPICIDKDKKIIMENVENKSRQILLTPNTMPNKSSAGRWKRRKGQAPSRPIAQRKIVKIIPESDIKRELGIIEIQQQGLEKQGVKIEEIIREKDADNDEQVPIEVEDLILQLFELVNEKNELFRRQAELTCLLRQQKLEEEYANVEYEIRCLTLQPEATKSDSDKLREEILINRLIEIVDRRNEIVECLEMDRKREIAEDNSISSQLNLYSAKREESFIIIQKEIISSDKKKKHKKLSKKIIGPLISPFKHKKEKDSKNDNDKNIDESLVEASTSSGKGKNKLLKLF